MHFLPWNCLNFDYSFTEVCSLVQIMDWCRAAWQCCHLSLWWFTWLYSVFDRVIGNSRRCNKTSRNVTFHIFFHKLPGPKTTFTTFNSLSLVRCCSDFKSAISKHILQIKFIRTSCEMALRQMPQNMFHDKSALVQAMASCHQATSHYLRNAVPDLFRYMALLGVS